MQDLISRQAAIDAFLTELTKRERKNLLHTWSTVEVKYFVVDMLEKSPSAQPEERRSGKGGGSMRMITKDELTALRSRYPAGTRVELLQMDDVQAPPTGIKGGI